MPLSGDNLTLTQIVQHRDIIQASVNIFHSSANPQYAALFFGLRPDEIDAERDAVAEESDLQAILTILSALEAAFRIDFLTRCENRLRDDLSRAFRAIHKAQGARVRFEEDILEGWRQHSTGANAVVSALKSAMKLRHWLAHGRYWVPRLGRDYDFVSVQTLATLVYSSFPLKGV